jgi:Mce-associated membrane protein
MAEHVDAATPSVTGSAVGTASSAAAEADHAGGAAADTSVDRSTETLLETRDSAPRLALTVSVAIIVILGCLGGWLAYRTQENRETLKQRSQFVEAATQGAVNLTTLNYTDTDADVKRILDSTTGSFHDDFQKGSQPFANALKQARSKSEGTVTAAGLESLDGEEAQVLVAVSVTTSNALAPEQEPRSWRMRIGVKKVGEQHKVSAVQFVS